MSSRLVNVRLDEQRLRKVKSLRKSGIAVSDLVREAIDQKYAELERVQKPRDVDAIMDRIFRDHPDPPGMPPLGVNVHDRHEAREAIVRHLEAKHRRDTEWYLKARAAETQAKPTRARRRKTK